MARQALVTSKWLAEAVGAQGKMRLLDASWYLPKLRRSARSEFKRRHIAGAAFFDIEQCCDRTSPLDHMLPSEKSFADYVGNLGIEKDTHVVVYDASEFGAFSAPRVWWMFRVFGHRAVSLLNGGLRNWELDGGPVSGKYQRPAPSEFRGLDPEPRDNTEPGHIPGSICVPFNSFLSTSGHFLPKEQLQTVFGRAGIDLSRPLCILCGSGVTACHVAFAAHECGNLEVSVYDGGWSEWYTRAVPEHVISEGRGKHL
ncbi:3-mercaptopyruvate sulfurtransferase isoform X2 [Hippoglossus stenolepis]|uniref:3-mercaptopyruvate sulfurtransferase isoform X2 n=1 Tax=Hippoglossus stenolepis TaxID=195615 RepID=UPI00159C27CD|nr:3-mercaptopyruvate sulfurtransferase isoform X2 [Hippoglossus stenolepis]